MVNVIVKDKRGPVSDLRRDSFAVFDRGKRQRISVFAVDTSDATLPGQTMPSEPNLFTNVMERRANTPTNVTVILLDGLNTRITDQQYVQRQIEEFLTRLHRQDRVAIYTLGRTLSIVRDFTGDAEQLGSALSAYSGRNDSNAEAMVFRPIGKTGSDRTDRIARNLIENGAANMMPLYQTDSARRTAAAIAAIANHVAPVPGRKSLVWVSSSFPFMMVFVKEILL